MKHYGLGQTNNSNHLFTTIHSYFTMNYSCGRRKFLNGLTLLFFLLISTSAHSQITDYFQLDEQDRADFSRWLGWVWGDGIPDNTADLTGIKYTGPSATKLPEFDNRYNEFTESLAGTGLGMLLANGGTNTRRIKQPWNFWIDGIPGGDGNSELLRDAVRNPNFLAGIIDTEGGIDAGNYYIDDHFYAPSHPDTGKGWGLRNFGPNRMIQLYHLLGDTYGFEKTFMQIGINNQPTYTYANPTERQTAIDELIEKYNSTKAMNENGSAKIFRVRIYIHSDDWETLRSYGYWIPPRRYPKLGGNLVVLQEGDRARADLENVGESEYVILQHKSTNKLLRSNIELANTAQGDVTLWKLLDIGNGYFRIVSKANNLWLRAIDNKRLQMVPENFTGFQTQWKIEELSNGSYLITNRWINGNILRVNSQIYVRHGSGGATAHWNIIGLN